MDVFDTMCFHFNNINVHTLYRGTICDIYSLQIFMLFVTYFSQNCQEIDINGQKCLENRTLVQNSKDIKTQFAASGVNSQKQRICGNPNTFELQRF